MTELTVYIARTNYISGIKWGMLMTTSVNPKLISFFVRGLFFVSGSIAAFGQGMPCDAVPDQILVNLNNPSDLAAVATTYSLQPTPLDQVGTPATYRMAFLSKILKRRALCVGNNVR